MSRSSLFIGRVCEMVYRKSLATLLCSPFRSLFLLDLVPGNGFGNARLGGLPILFMFSINYFLSPEHVDVYISALRRFS